jgi:hypothetical protein
MRLSNSGSIVANDSSALTISLGSEDGVNNASGALVAKGAGGLILQSGTFTSNGTMEADDASAVTFQSGAADTNTSAGVLTGGIWKAISTGGGATVSVTGGAVTTDHATNQGRANGVARAAQCPKDDAPYRHAGFPDDLRTTGDGGLPICRARSCSTIRPARTNPANDGRSAQPTALPGPRSVRQPRWRVRHPIESRTAR